MSTKIRLNAALNWINEDDSLADIGCDHGYLAIDALKKGLRFVQLVDNKKGPLDVARLNLEKNNFLNENIKLTLASGLTELDPLIDTVAILGMGGELIIHILEESKTKNLKIKKYIFEANTKIPVLRRYLFDNYYQIIEEKIVKENGKYYELILATKVEKINSYDEYDVLFGPYLRKERNPLFIEKWSKIYDNYQNIIKNNNNEVKKIRNEIRLIEGILWQK